MRDRQISDRAVPPQPREDSRASEVTCRACGARTFDGKEFCVDHVTRNAHAGRVAARLAEGSRAEFQEDVRSVVAYERVLTERRVACVLGASLERVRAALRALESSGVVATRWQKIRGSQVRLVVWTMPT